MSKKLPPPTSGPGDPHRDPWEFHLVTITGICLTRRDLARQRIATVAPFTAHAAYMQGYEQAYAELFEMLSEAVRRAGGQR